MVLLLPEVHGLLVLLPALQDDVVKHAQVGDMAVLLEPPPYLLAHELWRDVQCVEGADFWGLACKREQRLRENTVRTWDVHHGTSRGTGLARQRGPPRGS